MPTRLPVRLCALALSILISISIARAGEDADALAPALKGEPSADGLITWWLNTPLLKDPFDKIVAARDVREGDAVPGTDGKWSLYIAPARSVNFREYALTKGVVLSYTHIYSATGGARKLMVASCGAVKVFLNGLQCIDKAEPITPVTDLGEVTLDLAKGMNQICIATNMRQGYFTNFQFAIRSAPAGTKPAAGDLIVLPMEKGKEPQPEAALIRALSFTSKEAFVKPGDTVTLAAYILGSVPWNLGLLTPSIVDQDGNPVPADVPRTAAELSTRSFWQSQYTVPATNAPAVTLTLQIKAGEKTVGSKTLSLFNGPGLQATAAAFSKSLQERAQRAGHALPNAALYVEKASTFLNKIETHDELPSPQLGDAIVQFLETAKRCALAEEAGNDPWEGKSGYFEKAYQSHIDESAQPYQIQVPKSFSAAKKDGKKYPLVLFLHGYVPYYDRQHWWDEAPDFDVIFEKHDCFLALPFGRSNTDFQSCGETDVLDVLADVIKNYPIDENRVYLYGYSMGGMGVYTIGAHHPDLFAAGVVLAGRADSPLQNFMPLTNFAPYKQWVIQADNPISLCENFVNIPLRLYHGRDDTIIKVSESNRMEARLRQIGCDVKLQLGPGSHGYGLEVMFSDDPVSWLLSHTRATAPAKNHLKAYRLEYAKQNDVAVTAANTTTPAGELQPIELEWSTKNGVPTFAVDDAKILQRSIAGKLDPAKLDGLHKSPQLCGPIREAICSAFMVVYGTKGTAQAVLNNRRNADQFAADWKEFSKSPALIKADTEVTDAEKQSKNLFLFGEEQDNTIHAECAAKLPIFVKNGNVVIDNQTIPLAGKGIMYMYPSPLTAAGGAPHSVVICAGMLYGQGVSSNHKLDLVPDFILFDDKRDNDGTNTNHALCAGFFNGEWKLDPKTTWWDK